MAHTLTQSPRNRNKLLYCSLYAPKQTPAHYSENASFFQNAQWSKENKRKVSMSAPSQVFQQHSQRWQQVLLAGHLRGLSVPAQWLSSGRSLAEPRAQVPGQFQTQDTASVTSPVPEPAQLLLSTPVKREGQALLRGLQGVPKPLPAH